MGTTGAPWNIPFVEPTDVPRGYPQDSEDLALAIAAGLDAAGSPGIGPNVVQTIKTNTFSTTSTSFTNVTGLSVTITPTSDTSKVLIIVDANITNDSGVGQSTHLRVTGGNAGTYVGGAEGSRVQAAATAHSNSGTNLANNQTSPKATIVYLDSPATDTATTYQVEMSVSGVTGWLNRSAVDSNTAVYARLASSITAIEVAV